MKNLKIALAVLVGALAAGCYNDFDTPAPRKLYTDTDMTALGLEHVTIKEVKDYFGPISGTGTNRDWETTQTVKFGELTSEEQDKTKFPGLRGWSDAANYYIKGKVISSDRQGNIYKSLYIYDGTAAIELKLYNGLYLDYYLDLNTMESQWVYVRLGRTLPGQLPDDALDRRCTVGFEQCGRKSPLLCELRTWTIRTLRN